MTKHKVEVEISEFDIDEFRDLVINNAKPFTWTYVINDTTSVDITFTKSE